MCCVLKVNECKSLSKNWKTAKPILHFPAKVCFFLRVLHLTEWLKVFCKFFCSLWQPANQNGIYICTVKRNRIIEHARHAASFRKVFCCLGTASLAYHWFLGNVWSSFVGDFWILIPSPCRETHRKHMNDSSCWSRYSSDRIFDFRLHLCLYHSTAEPW